jgi:hypothetical protein
LRNMLVLLHTGTNGSGCHGPSNLHCAVAPQERDRVRGGVFCKTVGVGGGGCVVQAKEEKEGFQAEEAEEVE